MIRLLPFIFGFSLVGCAGMFETLVGETDDASQYDRGYEATQETNCSGRFCLSQERAAAEEDSFTGSRKLSSEEGSEGSSSARQAIRSRDVILGMTRQEVLESWGEPAQREVAGKGSSGHERWTYGSRFSLQGSRTLIFEDGRITGWHR